MKVYHEEFGEGQIINSTEVLDEAGNILYVDVMFEHGVELSVSSEELSELSKEFYAAAANHDAKHKQNLYGTKMTKAGAKPAKLQFHKIPETQKEEAISEKLTKDMSAADVIDDFVHSDDPKFKGKSKEERKKMALGAYYSMHPELKKEEVELEEDVYPLWGMGINKFRSFIEEEDTPVKRGRGRPMGSKSFGAAKRAGMSSTEAGGPSEPPSFTDQLLKAADNRDGGHVKFDNGKTHHIPRPHAIAAIHHLGKPEKPAEKEEMRKHMGASKENFDSIRTSGGKIPSKAPAYDPDARIKARTKSIVGEGKELSAKQKKIAALAPPADEIDAKDLEILRNKKKAMKEETESKTSVYTEANRYRAVESAVREIMSKNHDIRAEAKEAEWKRNNPGLVKD